MNVNPLSSTEWMEPKLLITAPTWELDASLPEMAWSWSLT
jgi:hypothetical protein